MPDHRTEHTATANRYYAQFRSMSTGLIVGALSDGRSNLEHVNNKRATYHAISLNPADLEASPEKQATKFESITDVRRGLKGKAVGHWMQKRKVYYEIVEEVVKTTTIREIDRSVVRTDANILDQLAFEAPIGAPTTGK